MTGTLANKTALITGASRGIGRETALKLAGEGALVCVHYGTNAEAAEQVLREIEAAGGQGFLLQGNVADVGEIKTMFEALDRELASRGIERLDILVNNAGVGVQGSVEDVTEADFDLAFATNVKGLLFVSQHAVPRLRDGGRIINLSSMVGHNAYPTAIAYAATKAAVDSMTLSMAQGLGGRRITVNAVAPGATRTDFIAFVMDNEPIIAGLKTMTALGEIGEAGDIASVIAFLASDAARWITGERIRASGGMHL